jgi:hypothetical protein
LGNIRDELLRKPVEKDNFKVQEETAEYVITSGSKRRRTKLGYFPLSVYSGHDNTIGPLLSILGVFDNRWPLFGANIVFEIYKADNTRYIRVLYDGKIQEICLARNQQYNGDPTFCKLDSIIDRFEKLVPVDYFAECDNFQ